MDTQVIESLFKKKQESLNKGLIETDKTLRELIEGVRLLIELQNIRIKNLEAHVEELLNAK